MPFRKIDKFEQISSLSDEESYAEFMKLSLREQVEYDAYMREKAEHYKKLTLKEAAKMKELERKIEKKEEEYRRLKGLH
jgi:wyosine [tRNA(Phe)-imidazoG37] synthetase (radical SAM superfamily)